MDTLCPKCYHPMDYATADVFNCRQCRKDYQRWAYCPECRRPLCRLQGCGATDYFCEGGHGLISRQRVIFAFQEREG